MIKKNNRYVFGPVPSRRLGRSLGISPIPEKTCNYSCTYCQLGRTDKLTNERKMFFPVEDIIEEFKGYDLQTAKVDIITIVGEGEPTLYLGLGELLKELKKLTNIPVAVITNGALLYDIQVRKELSYADIVLPSMDSFDGDSFKKIDRPHGKLDYDKVFQGLVTFSQEFEGQIWVEIMLIDGVNTEEKALQAFNKQLKQVRHDRVYINTPVRPPAESDVKVANSQSIARAVELLGAISIDMLAAGDFYSDVEDDLEAVISIASRHPMNQFEVGSFLDSRMVENKEQIIEKLKEDSRIRVLDYKGILTFRARKG